MLAKLLVLDLFIASSPFLLENETEKNYPGLYLFFEDTNGHKSLKIGTCLGASEGRTTCEPEEKFVVARKLYTDGLRWDIIDDFLPLHTHEDATSDVDEDGLKAEMTSLQKQIGDLARGEPDKLRLDWEVQGKVIYPEWRVAEIQAQLRRLEGGYKNTLSDQLQSLSNIIENSELTRWVTIPESQAGKGFATLMALVEDVYVGKINRKVLIKNERIDALQENKVSCFLFPCNMWTSDMGAGRRRLEKPRIVWRSGIEHLKGIAKGTFPKGDGSCNLSQDVLLDPHSFQINPQADFNPNPSFRTTRTLQFAQVLATEGDISIVSEPNFRNGKDADNQDCVLTGAKIRVISYTKETIKFKVTQRGADSRIDRIFLACPEGSEMEVSFVKFERNITQ